MSAFLTCCAVGVHACRYSGILSELSKDEAVLSIMLQSFASVWSKAPHVVAVLLGLFVDAENSKPV